jgi:hypothetical protein
MTDWTNWQPIAACVFGAEVKLAVDGFIISEHAPKEDDAPSLWRVYRAGDGRVLAQFHLLGGALDYIARQKQRDEVARLAAWNQTQQSVAEVAS